MLENGKPLAILRPWNPIEALPLKTAASECGVTCMTMIRWCSRHHVGRLRCGRWYVSRVALRMLNDGRDHDLLRRYLEGDRTSPEIVAYFRAAGVDLPTDNTALVSDNCRSRLQNNAPKMLLLCGDAANAEA